MKNLLFTLAGIATFAFTACDKDDDEVSNVEPMPTRTEIIAGSDWMMISSIQTANGQTTDLLAAQPVTARDDVFSFEANGQVVREEGATKEVGKADIVDTGTWAFMNEEKDLKIDLQTFPANDQIVELKKEKLVIRNFDGVSETVTIFMAQ